MLSISHYVIKRLLSKSPYYSAKLILNFYLEIKYAFEIKRN